MLIDYKMCAEIVRSCHGSVPRKILHIGAHTGEEAESYINNGVDQIIWFEANSQLIEELKHHLNNFQIKQQIVNLALWDTNTLLDFHITNNLQSSSLFELAEHEKFYPQIKLSETRKVHAFRLDSIIDSKSSDLIFTDFDFINIDTQGAELSILKGMGKYLLQESVKAVYLEVNARELYKNIPLISEIDQFMSDLKFHRIKTKMTNEGWGDAIYVRENYC